MKFEQEKPQDVDRGIGDGTETGGAAGEAGGPGNAITRSDRRGS